MAKNRWILPDGFDKSSREAVKAILSALETSGKEIPPEAFTALQLGDVAGFLEFVNWDQIRNEFGDLTEIMRLMASTAGQSTFTMGGVQAQLLFDLIDARAVDYAQKRVGELIVDIGEQMRETVRDTIARASAGEMTYQQAALRLQSTISLTSRDAGAANKFIEKQYQRFMRSGLSDARARIKAQNMGAKYASKLLRSRTNTIARTEIADAAMAGRYLGWEAGVTAGLISNESVKEWIAEPNACPICKALDGKVIGWNEAWDFPEGVSAGLDNNMPPAHPNCRCSVAILPPDFADNVFTPSSGGEMPEEAEEFTKHLPGKHDQSTHGRKKGFNFDLNTYDSLRGSDTDKFREAMSSLTSYDGTSIDSDSINFAEHRFGFRSSEFSEDMGIDYEGLDKTINKYLDKNPVSVMMEEEVIESILDDGEIKSVFALRGDPKGKEYTEQRLLYERAAFGYDQNTPIEMRPVSGTVFSVDNNNVAVSEFGDNYGQVQIVLKDDVKSRTTFTIGDSLDKFQRPTKYGGKVPRTVDIASVAQNNANANRRGVDMFEATGFRSFEYVETQVHGGIKLSDINKIVFHSPMYIDMEGTTNRLNDMGIGWEVVDG